jgi:hypothetical protein
MIWAVCTEHDIGVFCRSQWLGRQVSLVPRVRLTHLFGAVGGLASVCSRLVAEVARTSHGPSIPSRVGVHGQGCSSNLSGPVIAHWLPSADAMLLREKVVLQRGKGER